VVSGDAEMPKSEQGKVSRDVFGFGAHGGETFGSTEADTGANVAQKKEVAQPMIRNAKGLWVRADIKKLTELQRTMDGKWTCNNCKITNISRRIACSKCQRPKLKLCTVVPEAAKPTEEFVEWKCGSCRHWNGMKYSRCTWCGDTKILKAGQRTENERIRNRGGGVPNGPASVPRRFQLPSLPVLPTEEMRNRIAVVRRREERKAVVDAERSLPTFARNQASCRPRSRSREKPSAPSEGQAKTDATSGAKRDDDTIVVDYF